MTSLIQGLAFRITAATVLILLVLGAATGLLVRGMFYRSLSSELDSRGSLLARYIAVRNADTILEEDDLALLDIQLTLVNVMKEVPSLEYGYIQNSRGRILAHTFTRPFPPALLNINRVGNDRSLSILRMDVGDHVVRDIAASVAGPGTGEIHLGISERSLDADLHAVTIALLTIFGGVLFTGLALAGLASNAISRPVQKLRWAAERLGAGKLQTRVNLGPKGEFGILGEAFNAMAEKIKRSHEGLWALNQELKEEVGQRKQAQEALGLALREKETLLREVHHRVKNNLQALSSLLNLQIYHDRDERTRSTLSDCCNRLQTMSLIHRGLYESGDVSSIQFAKYIEQLSRQIMESQATRPDKVTLSLDLEATTLPVDTALPAGLILNELLTNAIKHAFPNGRGGRVAVHFKSVGKGRFQLEVEDDGVGLPEGVDFSKVRSMGMQLVKILTEQLGGTVEVGRGPSARFTVTFSEYQEAETLAV